MPTIKILRQPEGRLGLRLSGNNVVSEVHAGGVAQAAGLKVGWLVTAINEKPTVSENAAQETLQELVKKSVFKFSFECSDAPAAGVGSKEAATGAKRKADKEMEVAPKEKEPKVSDVLEEAAAEPAAAAETEPAATTTEPAAAAPKPKEPKAKEPKVASRGGRPSLATQQTQQWSELLTRQRKEITDLQEKHAKELAVFQRRCLREQAKEADADAETEDEAGPDAMASPPPPPKSGGSSAGPEWDEKTGEYKKPRGRPPADKTWDGKKGVYV